MDENPEHIHMKGKGKKGKKKKRYKPPTEDDATFKFDIDDIDSDAFDENELPLTCDTKPYGNNDSKSNSDTGSKTNGDSEDSAKAILTPDSGISEGKVETEANVDDYKVKVETLKDKLRSSKTFIDNETKTAQQKIVRTGFWDKLRYAMSQPVEEEQAVAECRRMFREEMVRLRREVEEFQELCLKQIKTQKQYVDDHRRSCEKEMQGLVPRERNGISRRLSIVAEEVDLKDLNLKEELQEELKEMESSMDFTQQKQKLLDQETELNTKEEELAKKHKDLEEYEKEIQEVESLLNQRQAICDRRQKHLLVLDEELHSLRQELEDSKEELQNEATNNGTESATAKAKKNWDIVRRNLMDKQHLLEGTVQKYRSELAAASSNIAGKEILIAKLQQQLTETEGMVITSERKIKQLESKLAFSVTESRILEDQLHGVNRKNSLNQLSPEDGGGGGGRRGSLFGRRTSSDTPRSKTPSPRHGDESRDMMNGSLSARPSSLSPQNTSVIRRRSMRSNSVAGDTLSKLELRNKEKEQEGSGACVVM